MNRKIALMVFISLCSLMQNAYAGIDIGYAFEICIMNDLDCEFEVYYPLCKRGRRCNPGESTLIGLNTEDCTNESSILYIVVLGKTIHCKLPEMEMGSRVSKKISELMMRLKLD